jgi:hypothetical protein
LFASVDAALLAVTAAAVAAKAEVTGRTTFDATVADGTDSATVPAEAFVAAPAVVVADNAGSGFDGTISMLSIPPCIRPRSGSALPKLPFEDVCFLYRVPFPTPPIPADDFLLRLYTLDPTNAAKEISKAQPITIRTINKVDMVLLLALLPLPLPSVPPPSLPLDPGPLVLPLEPELEPFVEPLVAEGLGDEPVPDAPPAAAEEAEANNLGLPGEGRKPICQSYVLNT